MPSTKFYHQPIDAYLNNAGIYEGLLTYSISSSSGQDNIGRKCTTASTWYHASYHYYTQRGVYWDDNFQTDPYYLYTGPILSPVTISGTVSFYLNIAAGADGDARITIGRLEEDGTTHTDLVTGSTFAIAEYPSGASYYDLGLRKIGSYSKTVTLPSSDFAQGTRLYWYIEFSSDTNNGRMIVYGSSHQYGSSYTTVPATVVAGTAYKESTFRWNVQTAVGVNGELKWNTLLSVVKSGEMLWNTWQAVDKTGTLTWNTLSNLTEVYKDGELLWNVYANVIKDAELLWNTRVGVMQSMLRLTLQLSAYTDLDVRKSVHTALEIEEVA